MSADPQNAPVAELVDALDSKSSSARSAGSIPARGTKGVRGSRMGTRFSLPNQNIENNPMQRSSGLAGMDVLPAKTF
jgi:hypothetical protein